MDTIQVIDMLTKRRLPYISALYNRGITGERPGVRITRIDENAPRKAMGSKVHTETTLIDGYPCSIRPYEGDMINNRQGEEVVMSWQMVGPLMYDTDGLILFKQNDTVYDGTVKYIIRLIESIGGGMLSMDLRLGELADARSY